MKDNDDRSFSHHLKNSSRVSYLRNPIVSYESYSPVNYVNNKSLLSRNLPR